MFTNNTFSQSVEMVDANIFKQLADAGEGIIIDVRTPDEYTRGHIANSTLINYYDKNFINKINLMQKTKPVYVYCLSGARSSAACKKFSKNGFNKVYNLQGGTMAWAKAGFSLVSESNGSSNSVCQ